jgi:hypothetical protein
MARKLPPRKPRAAFRRNAIAKRRVGEDSQCRCGETRPQALIPLSDPTICAACQRESSGKKEPDDHHIAGKANNPMTISVPVNDHRADLSNAQNEWPRKTLENPERSPLRSAAAHIRGFVDTVIYLMEKFLLWAADMLELLDTILEQKLGQKWWKDTKLKSFEPKK